MKRKVLFLLTAALVVFAALYVNRGGNEHDPVAHAGERGLSKEEEVPEKYRETIHKGLDYLAKHQHADGHWEGDDGKYPVAMTGLIGLALVMEQKAKYETDVRKAADWLMSKSQTRRDGLIYSDHPSETSRYMEGHGFATIFLAGAYRNEQDQVRSKKLTDVLTQAVKYIVKAQSSQGGWYHTSKVEGHDFDTIATTAIQIQALFAAQNIGIPVPEYALNHAQEYLRVTLTKNVATENVASSRQTDTAAALACRIGRGETDKQVLEWFKHCQAKIPVGRKIQLGRDEILHYYFAQTMYNLGGQVWSSYRATMGDHLQSTQNKDGSWPRGDGIGVGTVYTTAMWCIVFQHSRNRHPSMPVIHEKVT
jgi:hypothetical protein